MANSSYSPLSGQVAANDTILPPQIRSTFGGFFRNKVVNGDFTVNVNGASFSNPANGATVLDGWIVSYDGSIGTFIISQQSHTIGQTDVPDEPQYFMRWAQSVAGSGSSFRRVEQRNTGFGVRTLAGKVATATFYLKADSARNVTLDLVQNFGTLGSATVTTSGGTLAVTTSWQRFSVNVTIPSISGKTIGTGDYFALRLGFPINTTMTIDMSHFQIEENGFTPFEQRPLNLESLLTLGLTGATFDQLAPSTIEGDIIYRNATTNTRLAKGTALQQLRTNAGATAPEWFTPATVTLPSPSFTSSEQVWTNSSATIIAHGLGAVPKMIEVNLKCVSAEQGYSVGDLLPLKLSNIQSGGAGKNVDYDATNITIWNANGGFGVVNQSSFALIGIDPAKWTMIAYAWA